MRRIHILGPLARTLALIMAVAFLLGSFTHQPTVASMPGQVSAAPLLIARADVHVETLLHGKDLELNAAITQTQDDCQAPLNGGVCLRYSVVLDEQPIMVGYGVIPQENVRVTPSSIALKVDTRTVLGFINVVGAGGLISITWNTASPTVRVGVMRQVVARGDIVSFTLSTNNAIATMIIR